MKVIFHKRDNSSTMSAVGFGSKADIDIRMHKGLATSFYDPEGKPISAAQFIERLFGDAHATGLLWMAEPLIVLDVYEHAYYVDYKNQKGNYVDKFLEHIDWDAANTRFGLA